MRGLNEPADDFEDRLRQLLTDAPRLAAEAAWAKLHGWGSKPSGEWVEGYISGLNDAYGS